MGDGGGVMEGKKIVGGGGDGGGGSGEGKKRWVVCYCLTSKVRGAAKHPTKHRTAPNPQRATKNYPASNVKYH